MARDRIPAHERLEPVSVEREQAPLARRQLLRGLAAATVVGLGIVPRVEARPPTPNVPAIGLPRVEVVLYGTAWCPACNQARRFFQERRVPFVDVDVEHDATGRAEMRRLAQSSGIDPRLVPLVRIGDRVFSGFEVANVERLLRTAGF